MPSGGSRSCRYHRGVGSPEVQRQVRQQRADIDSLYELVEHVEQKVDDGFTTVGSRFGQLETRIDTGLGELETRFGERLGQLETKVDGLDTKLDQILDRLTGGR